MVGHKIVSIVFILLVPMCMISMGYYFKKGGTREINWIFGYRTSRSMKNKDTWRTAHEYCGKLWVREGWTLLILTIVPLIFSFNSDKSVFDSLLTKLGFMQLLGLCLSILPVERKLKKTFDEDGNRIDFEGDK